MRTYWFGIAIVLSLALIGAGLASLLPDAAFSAAPATLSQQQVANFDQVINANSKVLLGQGKQIFRFDTFGDEAFWGDTLHLHQAIGVKEKQISRDESNLSRGVGGGPKQA